MGKIPALVAYLVFALFLFRIFYHAFIWIKAFKQHPEVPVHEKRTSFSVVAATALDVLFFRRLFKINKLLWTASWAFHVCFFLILLRHSWYFLNPVPDFIIFMQPAGVAAGYLIPLSLLFILLLRRPGSKDVYISRYNVFFVSVLLLMSLTGLMMRNYFQPDLIEVKDYIMGMLLFHPEPLPENYLFITHFLFFLLLLPFFPFHLFTAPIVTLEAQKREQTLDMVMHEK